MKNYIGLLVSMMVFASCVTTKVTDLEGQWNVVEINGMDLEIPEGEIRPFIGFDTKEGRIYGNAGCNAIMSSFDLQSEPGVIDFSGMATTMMAGPGMDTERKVLDAMSKVTGYKTIDRNEMALCDKSGKPIVVLEKRFYPMTVAELEGRWEIVSVGNVSVTDEMEEALFMVFDTKGHKISGYAGCNNFMGQFETDEANGTALTIAKVVSTRKLCPDMEVESSILSAFGNVRTFGRLDEDSMAFYDASGIEIMELEKSSK